MKRELEYNYICNNCGNYLSDVMYLETYSKFNWFILIGTFVFWIAILKYAPCYKNPGIAFYGGATPLIGYLLYFIIFGKRYCIYCDEEVNGYIGGIK